MIERDILKVPSGEILEGVNLKKGEAAVLIGGPPCQLVMVASRDGSEFRFPGPTHADPTKSPTDLFSSQLSLYRTAWDALADVGPEPGEPVALTGRWADLLPSIPEGHNYPWHTSRMGGEELFGWRRRYWSFLLKLAKHLPSWTVQAQPGPAVGPFHWQNRRLSMRELARIQTFPDDIQVRGSRTEVQRQIGNAVPSLLAEVFAREIATQFFGKRKQRSTPKLLPPDRSPCSPAEPTTKVPAKFRPIIGARSAHPGTGLGNRAVLAPSGA